MPLYFYDLPNWLFGLLICGGWVAIGVTGHLVFHRVCRAQFGDGEKNLAIALLAVIATVNSLLLAFSAVSVWETFGAADRAVRDEAVAISALGRDLAVFGTAESLQARQLLKTYARTVVRDEWPNMRTGHPDDSTWTTFDLMFRAVGSIEPRSLREEAWMLEILARTNELIKHRRERLYAAECHVPSTLWTVVVIGTFMTILSTYIFPRTAFNLTAVGVLSGSLGLVFFFIAAMDRPFVGKESIGPEPIEQTVASMERWSGETRRLKAAGATDK